MKKLFLLLIPVLIFNCVESKKQYTDINQILIQKSIKWTKVASTSRNYEEAKHQKNKLNFKKFLSQLS